jgi:TolB-like protein/Tfp pilus assembly protein PilF
LPFADISDGPANQLLVSGIHEDLLNYLSRISSLKVISRASAIEYAPDPNRTLADVAKGLGVTHVLQGTVLRIGGRVRVHAQLVEAATDALIWRERYDREVRDVFAIQSDIAGEIASALRVRLSPEEKAALRQRPTDNQEAHDRWVEAKDLMNGAMFSATAREDLLQAVELLKKAAALDPKFHLAFYDLAHAHDQLYLRFDATPARLAEAEAAIQSLEQLQPDAGETHLARAKHRYWGYADYQTARAELALADQALPNDPMVPLLTGYIDRRQGRWDASTRNLQRALELDPANRYILQQIALTYFNQRRFREMAEVLDRAVAVMGNDVVARAQRAAVDADWRADTTRLRAVVQSAVAEDPAGALKIIDYRIDLALLERDAAAAERALSDARNSGCQTEALPFPSSWCEALAARVRGDENAAQLAFSRAREQTRQLVQQAPDNAAPCACWR